MTSVHRFRNPAPFSARRAIASLVLAAAVIPAAARSEELQGSVTLYGWLPWIDSEISSQSGGGSVETSVSAGDVLDALKFAFMAAGEVHYGRFGLLHDTMYSDLENSGTASGPLSAKIEAETKTLIATTALGYRVYASEGRLVEAFAGARYVDVETDVSIKGGGPAQIEKDASVEVNWWDPVIGLTGRLPLTGKLAAVGFADIGGFGAGSEFTWEVFGGLDYAMSERFSANAGFRYISIDYEADQADVELEFYGPVLGMTLRF